MTYLSHKPIVPASAAHAGVTIADKAKGVLRRGPKGNRPTEKAHEHDRARELDQFYTEPEVAKILVDWFHLMRIKHNLCQLEETTFIEPSAGTGSFLRLLPPGTVGYDLDPKGPGIIKRDFFEVTFNPDERIVVIGNPPFGKNADKAAGFFNHAAQAAEIIAFVVPLTFQKVSIQNRLDLNFHLIDELPLPANAFLFEGCSKHVPTVFQIWARRSTPRKKLKLPTSHPDFKFLKAEDNEKPQFAIQRVGANAGRVHRDFKASPSSHYFIAAAPGMTDLQTAMQALDFASAARRTSGNPSLAKTELVEIYARFRNAHSDNPQSGFEASKLLNSLMGEQRP